MAGFEVSAFAFPLAERFSGLGLTRIAGFAVSEPVVTGMAGFAVLWPPGLPGRRTAIPARCQVSACGFSKRTPVAC
jgi:hypothetical protein